MSYAQQIHHARQTIKGTTQEMRLEKWELVQEAFVSVLLASLAFEGIAPVISVSFIGIINTLTLGELYRAYRQVQAKNRQQIAEEFDSGDD